jgi:hypothetical protein
MPRPHLFLQAQAVRDKIPCKTVGAQSGLIVEFNAMICRLAVRSEELNQMYDCDVQLFARRQVL